MSAYTSISVSRDAAIKFIHQNINNFSNEELENIVNSISERSFIRCSVYNYNYDDDYMLSNNFCFEENKEENKEDENF